MLTTSALIRPRPFWLALSLVLSLACPSPLAAQTGAATRETGGIPNPPSTPMAAPPNSGGQPTGSPSGGQPSGTASGQAAATPGGQQSSTQSAGSSQPAQPMDCTHPIPTAVQGGNSKAVIELDPGTLWRPRGGEVRFTISGNGLTVENVQTCFAWSRQSGARQGASTGNAAAANTGDAAGDAASFVPSPLVRSITNAEGRIEYGAVVPDLPEVHSWWPSRIFGTTAERFTGLFTVPLADMQVVAQVRVNGILMPAAIVLPVGVTSVTVAIVLVVLAVAITCFCLYRIAVRRNLPGSDRILQVISTREGFGSLSQFQIMLWTFVVGASAIYVMSLSGNLISITAGALTLLGIAGAATLLARVPAGSQAGQASSPPPPPPPPPPAPAVIAPVASQRRTPRWSDLLVSDGEIDVTRVQMLIFTLISAGFVMIKVLTSYEIPEIPAGYLLLMGISNGVYIAGRHLSG